MVNKVKRPYLRLEMKDSMKNDLPCQEIPDGRTIDVWQIQLDSPLDPTVNLDNILSVEERTRASRFVFARDAYRFRICHAVVRLGLAWYLNKTPGEVTLTTGEYGKPHLTDPSGLYFNVTHAQELGLIAFTTIGEVGIDVEKVRQVIEALEIASTNFTRNESAMIAAAVTQREQARTFLRLWTRKEAVLKATGFGIVRGLDTVDVSQHSAQLVSLDGVNDAPRGSCWLLRDLELRDGFVGAIAAPPGDWSIRQWPICVEDVISHFLA